MRRAFLFLSAVSLIFAAHSAPPPQTPYGKRAEVRSFIHDMVRQHGFVERELSFLFSRARREPAILAAIEPQKDPKARSWQDYRARFVSEARIGEGAEFSRRNARTLARAAQ